MSSVAVLAVGIGLVWLVFWAVRNEGVGKVGEQSGLFKMRDWAAEQQRAQEEAQTGRWTKRRERAKPAATTSTSGRPKR